MNKFSVIVLAGLTAILTYTSFAASGTFSGRVWNDLNRDGIQDVWEPPMTNCPIYFYSDLLFIFGDVPNCILAVYYTDFAGYYNFAYSNSNGSCSSPQHPITNYNFFVEFGMGYSNGTSPANVGTNDNIDCDFDVYRSIHVTNDAVIATNMDLGVFYWVPGISMEMKANNYPVGSPLYVTNGTLVSFTYSVTNSGETRLSQLSVFDLLLNDIVGSVNCGAMILPGESAVFSTQVLITASITNYVQVSAIPVSPITCVQLNGYDPVSDLAETIILVVTNNPLDYDDGDGLPSWWEIQYGLDPLNAESPNANSDSDWMSNYEEYIADTNPTNGASYFPRIALLDPPPDSMSLVVSTSLPSRVYNVWQSTNLLDDPQSWLPLSQDQTGTSAAITFTITNDLPGAHYRTGVRLP